MKKLFLMGRSESGKTSLTQALKGESLYYHKTQYTYSDKETIDTPGEYAESKQIGFALACFSFDANCVTYRTVLRSKTDAERSERTGFINFHD